MGQCNTQPEDGSSKNEETFRQFSNEKWKVAYTNLPSPEKVVETQDIGSSSQRRYDSGQEKRDCSDTPMYESNQHSKEDTHMKYRTYHEQHTPSRHPNPYKNGHGTTNDSSMRDTSQDQKSQFRLSTSNSHSTEAQSLVPDGAVRTRCYRLNLDTQGLVSPTNCYNGPFEYNPACNLDTKALGMKHKYSDENGGDIMTILSADTTDESEKQVAIKTAQIFRDLAITDDGNIISMNPRANRGSSKSKVKPGEKSRQAAKIDKAKDLIDEVGKVDKMVSFVF